MGSGNFLIREFLIKSINSKKIISYLEYGYNGHSVISIIGNLFKGIDILAADYTFKYKKQKVHQRLWKLAHFFHKNKIITRYGKTKLISFKNRNILITMNSTPPYFPFFIKND